MIIDGMALWGEDGLTRAQVLARISAVPEMIAVLQAILDFSNPEDDESLQGRADQINRALNKAGV